MSFKTLHSFTVTIDKEIEKIETRNENGQEITIKSKQISPVVHTVVLKEPTRREKQDLSLWYGKCYNEALTLHGLSPRVFMVQRLARDPNSPLSQDDDKNLAKMYENLEHLRNDYMRVNALPESDEQKVKKETLLLDYLSLQKKVLDIETAYRSLFAHTAENYAQNKAITWLILYLSYVKNGDKYDPFFPGKDYSSREDISFDLDNAIDSLYLKSIDKLSTFWGMYYLGQATKPEDFIKLEEDFAKQLAEQEKQDKESQDKKVETKKDEVKVDLPAPVLTDPEPDASVQTC